LKGIEKREAIARAALKLIAVHGFHGAPMFMIADMAGVGTGTIYSYFENTRALISAVYQDVENEIMDTVRASYPISLPFRERFLSADVARVPRRFRRQIQSQTGEGGQPVPGDGRCLFRDHDSLPEPLPGSAGRGD